MFVYADDPVIETAVLHALAQDDGITAVSTVDEASWLVATTSMMCSSARQTGQRVFGFVTATEDASASQLMESLVSPILTAGEHAGRESPTLTPTSLASLAAALLRSRGEPSELAPREEAVLRLVAEGHATAEIAAALSYSERSVKNVIQGLTERLGLRNRCHAVAHAVRRGWI